MDTNNWKLSEGWPILYLPYGRISYKLLRNTKLLLTHTN